MIITTECPALPMMSNHLLLDTKLGNLANNAHCPLTAPCKLYWVYIYRHGPKWYLLCTADTALHLKNKLN